MIIKILVKIIRIEQWSFESDNWSFLFRLQAWIKSKTFSPLYIPLGPISSFLLKLPLVEVRIDHTGFVIRESIPQSFTIDHGIMQINTEDQWRLIIDNMLDFDVLGGDLHGFFTYVRDPLLLLHYLLQRSPDPSLDHRCCQCTKYPVWVIIFVDPMYDSYDHTLLDHRSFFIFTHSDLFISALSLRSCSKMLIVSIVESCWLLRRSIKQIWIDLLIIVCE